MIKRVVKLGIGLLATIVFIPTASAAVEYVKICQVYGQGWNYIPGTSTCINADTGMIKTVVEGGTVINANSALAARVARLEAQLRQFRNQFGIQLPDDRA